MKTNSLTIIVAGLLIAAIQGCKPQPESILKTNVQQIQEWKYEPVKDRYIVVLNKESVTNYLKLNKRVTDIKSCVTEMAETFTGKLLPAEERIYTNALQGFTLSATPLEIAELQKMPEVKSIEPEMAIIMAKGGKGGGGGGGGSPQPAQVTPYGIVRVGGSRTVTEKKAWIIDTGIEFNHPDLNVNTSLSKVYLSNVRGKKTPQDQHGHGTHVSGIIAAIDNTIGTVGVAQGCELVAVRVLDARGYGLLSDIVAGVDYVASKASAGDVVNMSLGAPASASLDAAIVSAAAKGIYFSLAAGNSADDASNYSPARVNGANIFTVSAMDASDYWAGFSNYGNAVDYCEPGVAVYSTWLNGSYATLSGTSMAAPHLAGILLVTGGNPASSGTVQNDPDGTPDPIGHL